MKVGRKSIHANPDIMPLKCPSNDTLDMRSWNTTNKIHAYLSKCTKKRFEGWNTQGNKVILQVSHCMYH